MDSETKCRCIAEWMGWRAVKMRGGFMTNEGPVVYENKLQSDCEIVIMSGYEPTGGILCAEPVPQYDTDLNALREVLEKLDLLPDPEAYKGTALDCLERRLLETFDNISLVTAQEYVNYIIPLIEELEEKE